MFYICKCCISVASDLFIFELDDSDIIKGVCLLHFLQKWLIGFFNAYYKTRLL